MIGQGLAFKPSGEECTVAAVKDVSIESLEDVGTLFDLSQDGIESMDIYRGIMNQEVMKFRQGEREAEQVSIQHSAENGGLY